MIETGSVMAVKKTHPAAIGNCSKTRNSLHRLSVGFSWIFQRLFASEQRKYTCVQKNFGKNKTSIE
jgi:hypothetical protein